MDPRRKSVTKAAGATTIPDNANANANGNKSDDRDDDEDRHDVASGFTGFSEAQLTRFRRFYNDAAQTGSERKPISGEGDDDDDNDDKDGDGSETPTSFPAGQTPFTLATSANMNQRELFSRFLYLIRLLLVFFLISLLAQPGISRKMKWPSQGLRDFQMF